MDFETLKAIDEDMNDLVNHSIENREGNNLRDGDDGDDGRKQNQKTEERLRRCAERHERRAKKEVGKWRFV